MFYKTILFASTREKVQQKVQKPPPYSNYEFWKCHFYEFYHFFVEIGRNGIKKIEISMKSEPLLHKVWEKPSD